MRDYYLVERPWYFWASIFGIVALVGTLLNMFIANEVIECILDMVVFAVAYMVVVFITDKIDARNKEKEEKENETDI